jgi:hypothetical protein
MRNAMPIDPAGTAQRGPMLTIPPLAPRTPPEPAPEPTPLRSTLVYVKEPPATWEYKVVVVTGQSELPGEAALNALGAEGWELAGTLVRDATAHFYFRRPRR